MKGYLYIPLLMVCLALTAIIPTTAGAAIFATDALYLFDGEKQVSDNSIIMQHGSGANQQLAVCENGACWLRQGPEWSAGPYHFFVTTTADNQTWQSWSQTTAQGGCNDEACYQQYLSRQIAAAKPVASITIPTVEENPATASRKTTGFTNRIGQNRYFKVDIKAGSISQLPDILKQNSK